MRAWSVGSAERVDARIALDPGMMNSYLGAPDQPNAWEPERATP